MVQDITRIIEAVRRWVVRRDDVRAIALVGSWARGEARPDSDVDIIILADDPLFFRRDTTWVQEVEWPEAEVLKKGLVWEDENYGAVWSRRLYLVREVELSFGSPDWAKTDPVDPGTREVIASGCVVLYDPDGLIRELLDVIDQT